MLYCSKFRIYMLFSLNLPDFILIYVASPLVNSNHRRRCWSSTHFWCCKGLCTHFWCCEVVFIRGQVLQETVFTTFKIPIYTLTLNHTKQYACNSHMLRASGHRQYVLRTVLLSGASQCCDCNRLIGQKSLDIYSPVPVTAQSSYDTYQVENPHLLDSYNAYYLPPLTV